MTLAFVEKFMQFTLTKPQNHIGLLSPTSHNPDQKK